MRCFYWLFIGWWLEPIKFVFKLMGGLTTGIIKMCFYVVAFAIVAEIFISVWGAEAIVCISVVILAFILKAIFDNGKYKNVNFDSMSGSEFEHFCSNVLRDNKFYGVKVTKGSGDHGIDILASKGGKKYAIQCKCYSGNVGNKAVQEAYSGKAIYKADVAVVMTNSYFTTQAKSDAKALGVELWDRNRLIDFLRNARGEKGLQKVTSNLIFQNKEDENRIDKVRKEVQSELDKVNSQNKAFDIFDLEEKIIRLKDGEISKAFFRYLDSVSRIAIDSYLQKKSDNEYTNEMNRCAEMPIYFYSAKYDAMSTNIIYIYYCKIRRDFKNTAAYAKLEELSRQRGKIFNDDLFQIDVFYKIGDIYLIGKKININGQPEVHITTSTMETIRLLEDIVDTQGLYKNLPLYNYITENSFFVRMDNMKFDSEEEKQREKVEIDKEKIKQTAIEIYKKFACFGINVEIADVNSDKDNIIFCIRQEQGVRVKTIMNYKPDISLVAGAECEMKLMPEKGYIGIFIPAKHFIKNT